MIAGDAPRNLRDVADFTLRFTCSYGELPHIERLCFAARWAVVELDDGRAGRAFTFNGQHAVYGALEFEQMRAMRELLGWRVDEALAHLLAAGHAGAPATSGDPAAEPRASLARSVALAVLNALSCEVNAPVALEERGFAISAPADRSFLHPDDAVALIGAGMLLQESATTCASVDVIDMRPRAALQSLLLERDGERLGPGAVRFHGVEDTERLVAQADVVGITGCALANESLFDIARLPRRAREFVVFGPSAQVPLELLAALGVTRVVTNRITDVAPMIEGMLAGFDSVGPRSATEGYVATLPCASAGTV